MEYQLLRPFLGNFPVDQMQPVMNNYKISPRIRQSAVQDCRSLYEFIFKYGNRYVIHQDGLQGMEDLFRSHFQRIIEEGYTLLSRHSSATSESVYYIPTEKELEQVRQLWLPRLELGKKVGQVQRQPEKRKSAGEGKSNGIT